MPKPDEDESLRLQLLALCDEEDRSTPRGWIHTGVLRRALGIDEGDGIL